ncbi:unnamed protein product [Closterium sp. NIES-54]
MDLTPSVWEEGEEAAAEGGDGEKVQDEPAGGRDNVETSGFTKEAVGSEGGEQKLGKAKGVQAEKFHLRLEASASRCWYQNLAAVLEEMGFRTSSCYASLFLKGEGEKLVLFLVYVDDILLFSSSMKEIQKVQQQLKKNFKCKTLGELHQEKFIKELGEKYGIENERKVATPLPAEFKLVKAAEDERVEAEEQQQFQSLVGSLLYATVQTRPDISFSVGQLARVVQNPSEEQVDAAERVVKYLNSNPSIGVQYSASAQVKQKGVEVLKEKGVRLGEGKLFLICFTEATWASEIDDSSSVGGYICVVVGGPVSWKSKKQTETTLSSVESEYMAMFHGVKEVIWLRRLLEEIGQEQKVVCLYLHATGPGETVGCKFTLHDILPSVCTTEYAYPAVSAKFIIQMDISTAFFNGILEKDVYMTQPPGFEDGTDRVCKLKKSIYGLKQAPRFWYQKLAAVLEEMGFRTSSCDESLFLKGEGEKLVLFLVYVVDILLFSSSMKKIQNVQQQLMKNLKCKTLGEVKYYLRMHVERDLDHRWLKLHQEKFIKELGEKYGIENERKVATPLPAEFKFVKAAEDEGVEA